MCPGQNQFEQMRATAEGNSTEEKKKQEEEKKEEEEEEEEEDETVLQKGPETHGQICHIRKLG